jgi:hypothetical protein
MKSTYLELIDDHREIDIASARLLAQARAHAAPHVLHEALQHLGITVRDHVSAESSALDSVEFRMLTGDWKVAWSDGQAAFDLLCHDWFEYLRGWSVEAIAADPASFAAESEVMLNRLERRMRFESDALYASALQSGTIRLTRSAAPAPITAARA